MSLGSELTAQRKKLGHDLPSMAAYLHIRLPYLQAIENDAFDQLPPGNAYRIGFLKSYAGALDLDANDIVALYHKEQSDPEKIPLRVRMPIKENTGATIGLAGILAALIVAGWIAWAYMHHSSDRRVADAVPPVPDRLQPQATVAPVPAAADSGEADEARDEAYALAAPKPAAAPQTVAAAPAGTVYGTSDTPSRVTITVVADTWMQIKQSEKTIYTGVLHPGDSYKIPDQPGWTMTAGNAAGVTLAVDGKPGAALGGVGAVIRDVPLNAGGATANR